MEQKEKSRPLSLAATSFNPSAPSFTPSSSSGSASAGAGAASASVGAGVGAFNLSSITEFVPSTEDAPADMAQVESEVPVPHPAVSLDEHGYVQPPMDPFVMELGPVLPLQHHLYAPPLSHTVQLPPNQRQINWFFVDERIRVRLAKNAEFIMRPPHPHEREKLPVDMHGYHSISAFEALDTSVTLFGHEVRHYKATSSADGRVYLLKRVLGYSLVNVESMRFVEAWSGIHHANVLGLKEAFTTKSAFTDDSMVFVYEVCPGARSLADVFFNRKGQFIEHSAGKKYNSRGGSRDSGHHHPQLDESSIWSYLCQIASALKYIHANGLAYQCLDLNNILLTGRNRIRLASAAIPAVIHTAIGDLAQLQQEDLLAFGQTLLRLACKSTTITDIHSSMDFVGRTFAPDMVRAIAYLFNKPLPTKSIDQFCELIASRIMQQFDMAQRSHDVLEGELYKELENSRLARLLIKFGFINERPEFEMDAQWSETGDRYLLKLFRDYVFHQVDAAGKPVLDLAHVISQLNMLDAGSDERVMLTSRDERSCLVVSYRDLKRCFEDAFNELSGVNRR